MKENGKEMKDMASVSKNGQTGLPTWDNGDAIMRIPLCLSMIKVKSLSYWTMIMPNKRSFKASLLLQMDIYHIYTCIKENGSET